MLTGFCLLVDCLKYLECQLEKAANRYGAPLVLAVLTSGVFVFQNVLINP